MPKHRTQLFFEPEQYEALTRISTSEGCSISEVVRRLVDQGLDRRREADDERLRALRAVGAVRHRLEERYGLVEGDPVANARDERARRLGDGSGGAP